MKSLYKITIKGPDGNPMKEITPDGVEHTYTTGFLIKVALGNAMYTVPKDQFIAYKVWERLHDDSDPIELEDAEFDLVKKVCLAHQPYQRGVMFVPFLQLFE